MENRLMRISNSGHRNSQISYQARMPKMRKPRLTDRYVQNFIDAMVESAKAPEKNKKGLDTYLLFRTEQVSIPIKNNGEDAMMESWYIKSLMPSDNHCIFLHGGTSNVPAYQYLYSRLSDYNINVLAVEYPGYGINKGMKASYETYAKSAEAAYKYLTEVEKVPADEIAVMGYCLGGYAASNLAKKVGCNSLFLISPMTSFIQTGEGYIKSKNVTKGFSFIERLFSKTAAFKLRLLNKFNTYRNLKDVKVPIYMMSSDKDVVFNIKWMDKLAKRLRKSKKRITYIGGFEEGHKLTLNKDDIITNIMSKIVFKNENDPLKFYKDFVNNTNPYILP